MDTGTIKFFNASKGFGFVTPDDGRADVFLPAAAVIAAGITGLKPGQRITFEQVPDVKGPKVTSLSVAQVAAQASEQVTVYCDANDDVTADVVAALRNSGVSVTTQDYIAEPPSVDLLKTTISNLKRFGPEPLAPLRSAVPCSPAG